MGIQMNQKELNETFVMISNWKNPLVSIVCLQIFQRFKGQFHMMDTVRNTDMWMQRQ